jgi:hypothetical protein
MFGIRVPDSVAILTAAAVTAGIIAGESAQTVTDQPEPIREESQESARDLAGEADENPM